MLCTNNFRYLKYVVPTLADVPVLEEVGSAYADRCITKGVALVFQVSKERHSDMINLLTGWDLFLRVPSAIDRAQFLLTGNE